MRFYIVFTFVALCIFIPQSHSQTDETMIYGTVVDDNGEPLDEVSVLIYDTNNHLSINNGLINSNYYQESAITKTDIDGHWELSDPRTAYGLYFTDEDGYAFIQTGKYTNGSNTTLTPWSTIHGKLTVLAGGNADESINMHVVNNAFGGGMNNFYFHYDARTNADGEFTFEHVIDRVFQVSHLVPEKLGQQNGSSYNASSTRVTTKPGEAFEVSLYSTTSAHPYNINFTVVIFVIGILIMIGLIFMMRRYAMLSTD